MAALGGGVIFNITGSSISDKADEAERQMLTAKKEIESICLYLHELNSIASQFNFTLMNVRNVYQNNLKKLSNIVYGKTNWDNFTSGEKLVTENTIRLVGLLYEMSKVKLVLIDNENSKKIKSII